MRRWGTKRIEMWVKALFFSFHFVFNFSPSCTLSSPVGHPFNFPPSLQCYFGTIFVFVFGSEIHGLFWSSAFGAHLIFLPLLLPLLPLYLHALQLTHSSLDCKSNQSILIDTGITARNQLHFLFCPLFLYIPPGTKTEIIIKKNAEDEAAQSPSLSNIEV